MEWRPSWTVQASIWFLAFLVLPSSTVQGRALLQCGTCSPNAAAVCASLSSAEKALASQTLVSACSDVDFQPDQCCNLRHSSQWEQVSACFCSGEDASAMQSVRLNTIDTICGCSGSRSINLPPLPTRGWPGLT
ncbi:hypothetical protein PSENEW3_00004887 [Picochlorum sp. SENEW3]|jgi:hypothetical protein|nr:hypothetical protein PSENEW3_00004887 [Picochlorum sp. SENEW3]